MLGFYEHRAKIKGGGVLIYKKWKGEKTQKMKEVDLTKNFLGKTEINEAGELIKKEVNKPYCGQVTRGSRKRMVEAIDLFCQSIKTRWIYNRFSKKRVKHTFTFITLTIPDQANRLKGKDGYNLLLEPFIFWLVKTKKVNTYIWKAELQSPLDFTGKQKQCKGQLHYHIILPNFIDWREVRKKWNYLLKINDLLGGHENPPSTSVERPFKEKNVAAYIIKEITKNCVSTKNQREIEALIKIAKKEDKKYLVTILSNELKRLNVLAALECENLGGKVWGCSVNLQSKMILKKDIVERDLHEIVKKIKDYEFSLKSTQKQLKDEQIETNLMNLNDKYIWEKSQLNCLKKKKMIFFEKQKNHFELTVEENFFRKLEFTINDYERRGDWSKNKNIFENEYVLIYNLPSDYKDLLLDTKYLIFVF